MTGLIALLVGKSLFGHVIGEKLARAIVIVALMFGTLTILSLAKCAYDRNVIAKHEAQARLEQAKRERKADTNLQIQKGRDEAAAQQRREEIDNATRNIPDQAPSARQRARACVELQRQAKEHRKPKPAC